MLTFKDFQYFEAAARLKSISGAAREQFVSQPAVSSAIKKMECYFSTQLFVRNQNSLDLSDTGLELYPYAQKLLELQNELFVTASFKQTFDTINVAIMSLPLYQSIFYSVKAAFNKLYPHITINICEYNFDTLPNSDEHSFICFSPQLNFNSKSFNKIKHWKVNELMTDNFCLIYNQHHREIPSKQSNMIKQLYSIDTLKKMSIYDEKKVFSHLKKLNFTYDGQIIYLPSASYDDILNYVKSDSSCFAILPQNFVRPYKDNLDSVNILDLNLFTSHHYIAYDQITFGQSAEAKHFLDLLYEEIKKYI